MKLNKIKNAILKEVENIENTFKIMEQEANEPTYTINGSLVGNTNGKNTTETVAEIMKKTTCKIEPVKEQHYSSTEKYLLHRIAELEEENEMLKTL